MFNTINSDSPEGLGVLPNMRNKIATPALSFNQIAVDQIYSPSCSRQHRQKLNHPAQYDISPAYSAHTNAIILLPSRKYSVHIV